VRLEAFKKFKAPEEGERYFCLKIFRPLQGFIFFMKSRIDMARASDAARLATEYIIFQRACPFLPKKKT
jgi:hypothetical protein